MARLRCGTLAPLSPVSRCPVLFSSPDIRTGHGDGWSDACTFYPRQGEVVSFPTLVFPTEYVLYFSGRTGFWLTTVPRSLDSTHDRQDVVVSVSTHRQVEWQTSDLISEHFSLWFYGGEAGHSLPLVRHRLQQPVSRRQERGEKKGSHLRPCEEVENSRVLRRCAS